MSYFFASLSCCLVLCGDGEMDLVINGKMNHIILLLQGDFCERPPVPQALKKGPARRDNYLAWGYRNVSTCVLDTIELLQLDKNFNRSLYGLPSDWGFDAFPCFKLSPMDCFREGNQFDYPEELQQLEQPGDTTEFCVCVCVLKSRKC